MEREGPIIPEIVRLESVPAEVLPGETAAGNGPGAEQAALPGNGPPADALPDAPVAVLREGRMRGQRIVVVGLHPVFSREGELHSAAHVEVVIPGATLLDSKAAELLGTSHAFGGAAPHPSNPAAARPALKVHVTAPGIQRVTGAALQTAGWELATLNPHHLQLWHRGVPVALHQLGTGGSRLDSADELRFYASVPGDRWNSADTYWLTLETAPGVRMRSRAAQPTDAPVRSTALARGTWRNNTFYDSLLPGPDGDHWLAGKLQTGPGRSAAALDLTIAPELPLAAGTSTFTVAGSAYTSGQHHLALQVGAQSLAAQWSGSGNWQQTFASSDLASSMMQLRLVPGAAEDGLEPDSIAWQRPVELDLAERGAVFTGVAGRWRYRLANVPPGAFFYDLRDLHNPVLLDIPPGSTRELEDGPAQSDYLVSGPGTLHVPEVRRHTPADFATPLNADVVYIAPAEFLPALAPLVAHRQTQGHAARAVELQSIYDAWSFGQVAPDAIRQVLQYAAATWQRPPTYVILVGDGTSDPLNYTKRNNRNLVPPYLAMVDPWLGETACETCYGQLDGESPLSDALPDLAVGRLPVKSRDELAAVVEKIIGYEVDQTSGGWRSRNLYITDNADRAGDFPALAEASAVLQPRGVTVERIYYDPLANGSGEPWREADPVRAHQRTVAALNAGAGFVNYVGHSYYWQWALTDPTVTPPYLLGLYDPDKLANGKQLPIILEMTCYTSAFHQPAYSGTTIDERLLLNPKGGAVATWGPTGMGVAYGHDALQRGFYQKLWSEPGTRPTLGTLTTAGYLELFAASSCCQDVLRTFALLGDPVTRPQVTAAAALYVPFVSR